MKSLAGYYGNTTAIPYFLSAYCTVSQFELMSAYYLAIQSVSFYLLQALLAIIIARFGAGSPSQVNWGFSALRKSLRE